MDIGKHILAALLGVQVTLLNVEKIVSAQLFTAKPITLHHFGM